MRASQKFLYLCLSRYMTMVLSECSEVVDTGMTLIHVYDRTLIFQKNRKTIISVNENLFSR